MIRIDLGRDELIGSHKKKPLPVFLTKIRLPNILRKVLENPPKFKGGDLWVIGGSVILFFLPIYLVRCFKADVLESHKKKVEGMGESITQLNRQIATLSPYQSELKSYEEQKKRDTRNRIIASAKSLKEIAKEVKALCKKFPIKKAY